MVKKLKRSQLNTIKRLNRNLKQSIRRANKNNNPLRIGTKPNGKPLTISGKSAKKERVRIAKMNNQYEVSKVKGLRQGTDKGFHMDARNLNFSSRDAYNEHMHWHNATAQNQILKDRSNSLRQSFRTRAESIGISKQIMDDFDERFKELNNEELLQTINENMENSNITFNDTFDSDQPTSIHDDMLQVINMYKVLGIADKVQYISMDDIGSSYVDNRNFTHYSFEQDKKKEKRRDEGRV